LATGGNVHGRPLLPRLYFLSSAGSDQDLASPPHGPSYDILPADDLFWRPFGRTDLNAEKGFTQNI
jgi:hypothetical protein